MADYHQAPEPITRDALTSSFQQSKISAPHGFHICQIFPSLPSNATFSAITATGVLSFRFRSLQPRGRARTAREPSFPLPLRNRLPRRRLSPSRHRRHNPLQPRDPSRFGSQPRHRFSPGQAVFLRVGMGHLRPSMTGHSPSRHRQLPRRKKRRRAGSFRQCWVCS